MCFPRLFCTDVSYQKGLCRARGRPGTGQGLGGRACSLSRSSLAQLWGCCRAVQAAEAPQQHGSCEHQSKQSLQQHQQGESHGQPTVLRMLKGH